jgi:ParB family chromosome partitioning protein
MGKGSKELHGASGESKILHFQPESLKLVKDEKSPLYDERVDQDLSDEFVSNIDFYGIIEPIVIRKNTETGEMEVVAGRQRVRGALEANKRRKKRGEKPLLVPAKVMRGEDLLMMGVMGAENEARTANTSGQKARHMQRMLAHGATEKDVALSMNCSVATVKNVLSLSEAPAAVRKAVDAGKITASIGYKLARMEPEEARAKLAEAVKEAPAREKGKRAGTTKRQLEIVTGEKAMPSRKEILAMKDVIEDHGDLGGEYKRVMVAVFDFVLGEPDDLNEIVGVYPEANEPEDLEEEAAEE